MRPFLLCAVAAALATASTTVPAKGVEPDPSEEQSMTDKIREKLSTDGYKDITVMPTSYAVTATDKEGKPVLLLIGPSSATTLKEAEPPSIAQQPDQAKDKFIEQ
jgi:hypothetical protein